MDKAKEAFEGWSENHHRNAFRYNRHDYKRDLTSFTAGYQAALEQPNNGWMPIKTAPKDGTIILLSGGKTDEDFYDGEYQEEVRRPVTGFWNSENEIWSTAYFEGDWRNSYINPTHWMPVPQPPQQ